MIRCVVRWLALAALGALIVAGPAAAAAPPYGTNDYGGFRNILPPGTNGLDNATQLAQFEANGTRPPNNNSQLSMYSSLPFGAPITEPQIPNYYKNATFGVPAGQVASSEFPEPGATIVRDKGFGVPHVYGDTRAELMFGTGYATAEDRLFFMDALRHIGRAQLSAFAGGAAGNRSFDASQWQVAPYTESDLQAQYDALQQDGPTGVQVHQDVQNYIDGINAYIAKAKLDPLLLPGEYAALERTGPADFQPTDVVAIASLIGAQFGNGGGGDQLSQAQMMQSFQRRFGARQGARDWADFVGSNDPEAPTTVRGHSFPYDLLPRHVAKGSVALPDPGTVVPLKTQTVTFGGGPTSGLPLPPGLPQPPGLPLGLAKGLSGHQMSNALLISARDSASGHPLAVMGPQTGYFSPEILMEEDIHGPGIDADGAAFPGTNFYVQLGHGRDYAWSATSADQDITDTFAVPLCNPSGGPVSIDSDYYRFRGQCLAMQKLQRINHFTPNASDSTLAGTETLTAYRTEAGLLQGRARIHGRPVGYVSDRSTYRHELDSVIGIEQFNDPGFVHDAASWQQAASHIAYAFNWFYADSKHTAFYNSGTNPARARGVDPRLPTWASFTWRGFDPGNNTAQYTPSSQHAQAIDQAYFTSWNDKSAPGDGLIGTPIYRSQMLDQGIQADLRGGRKMTLAQLINAMASAATIDLRGDKILPYLLRVIGNPVSCSAPARHRAAHNRHRGSRRRAHSASRKRHRASRKRHRASRRRPAPRSCDPALAGPVQELRAWLAAGAHRHSAAPGQPYQYSDAIRIMDAWWPRLVAAIYRPSMGPNLYQQFQSHYGIDNVPNGGDGMGGNGVGTTPGEHAGSAWDGFFFGYVQKDLREVLRLRVRGRYHRVYCGGGHLAQCRTGLEATLAQAVAEPLAQAYPADGTCAVGQQACSDSISFSAAGAITQPLIPWQNRPTFQQADEISGHR